MWKAPHLKGEPFIGVYSEAAYPTKTTEADSTIHLHLLSCLWKKSEPKGVRAHYMVQMEVCAQNVLCFPCKLSTHYYLASKFHVQK